MNSTGSIATIGCAPASTRTHHRGEPDAAEAEDRDGVAGPDARRVEHGAGAGDDRTAEERRDLERNGGIDDDRRSAVDDDPLREGRDAEVVMDGGAVRREAVAAAEQPSLAVGGRRGSAEDRLAARALGTQSAARHEREDDVVALVDVADSRSDRLDDAGCLVPEHHRHGPGPRPVDDGEVGVAEPRGCDP